MAHPLKAELEQHLLPQLFAEPGDYTVEVLDYHGEDEAKRLVVATTRKSAFRTSVILA